MVVTDAAESTGVTDILSRGNTSFDCVGHFQGRNATVKAVAVG